MQEEQKNELPGTNEMSVEEIFLKSQVSYEEAQRQAIEESISFNKTEFFRMDKFGTYRLRVMPLAPNADGTLDRKSFRIPVHHLLMELEKPSTGNKPSFVYVSVPRATQAGYEADLIDTYRKLAVDVATENGDEKLADKIKGGSYGGGLKFNYEHALYILDMNERAKSLQLLYLSHAQYCDLNERRMKLWQKKLDKNPTYPCPISSVYNAYPVEIEKKKNGGKTEYIIGIDNEADNDALSLDELNKLLSAPRIPEVVYRYSRYHFEATLEFLKQCDARYALHILETDEMIKVIEKMKLDIPTDDKSTFSFDKRAKDAKENADENELSFDMLVNKYDELHSQSLGDKTEEGQELRAQIRAFIEQEGLSVRVTRSTTNSELLDLIEEALQNTEEEKQNPGDESGADEPEDTNTSRRRR